jgi:hypothetical protein
MCATPNCAPCFDRVVTTKVVLKYVKKRDGNGITHDNLEDMIKVEKTVGMALPNAKHVQQFTGMCLASPHPNHGFAQNVVRQIERRCLVSSQS